MIAYVVAVGRITDAGLRDLCADYAGRLRRSLRLELREVRAAPGRAAPAVRLRAEADRLLAALPPGARVVALTRTGRAESSPDFARRLAEWRREGRDVAFVIGGAFGLDRRVLDRSDSRLSLSAMTLPHELARVVLLEQLYRASTILAGTPYHKASAEAS